MTAFCTYLLGWFATAALQTALLTGLILLANLACGRFLSPGWRHALWALALVPLVCPVLPTSSWSPLNLLRSSALQSPASPAVEIETAADVLPAPSEPTGAISSTPHKIAHRESLPVTPWLLAGLWAAALTVLGIHHLRTAVAFRRQLRCGHELDDRSLLAELAECRDLLHLSRPVRLFETTAVSSPALVGILRPAILLPPGLLADLSRDERQCLFLHELAHAKRLDLLVAAFASLCQLVHWFNPLAHFVVARLRATQEMACDAHALATRNPSDHQRLYSRTLLKLATKAVACRPTPLLAGMAESTSRLEARLLSIQRFRKPTRQHHLWGLATAALVALVGLSRADGPAPHAPAEVRRHPAPTESGRPQAAAVAKTPAVVKGAPQIILETLYVELKGDTPEAVEATIAKILPTTVRREKNPAEDATRAGVLPAADAHTLLTAATASGGAIIYAPQVATVSGQKAILRIVEERYFPVGWSHFDEKGKLRLNPDGTLVSAVPIFGDATAIGSATEVVASLQPDGTTVALEASARTVEQPSWTNETVRDARDATREFVVPVPEIFTRSAEATLTVPTGHTACLVASVVVSKEKVVKRTPLLGSLPVVGSRFRKEETRPLAKGLIVLLTPTVLGPAMPSKGN